nr:sorting nexin 2 [Hymenolepis microstoma]
MALLLRLINCFLHRIINHPVLIKDTDVHEFLELESELPRGIGGQGISGASAIKLLKNVGEAVGKLTFRMDESDEYFDLKDEELAIWEVQGSRLYAALSNLVLDQTDLAASTLASSKALSVFANVEEHTGLARALGQLADTEEQIAHFLSVEAEVQSTFLVEYAKGVLSMIQACRDTDVHEFLELESELPRGIGGQGISGASAIKLLKNVGEAVGKLTFRMDESDEYFDLKDEELAIWEVQGSRLYAALSNLVLDQTDLAASTLASSKALSVFANVEEHTGLARALGQLADTEEQIAHFLSVEAEVQSTFLVEYAKGVLSMIQACRDTLGERVRLFKTHRDCESALRGKREQKVRIEMSPKADRARIPILDREIGELTHKVEESEEDFEKISATIKKEFEHVDEARFEEFKAATLSYLTMILQMQEKTMTDDRPIGGGGGYKINWDEIDENTNPFGVGNAFGGNKLASSPPAGRAPPVQPDSTPASNIPVVSEDPLLNPSGKEVANEVRHVLDPSVTEFGDAKSVPKELKSHNKGPRPAPPKRTVSKGNSHEAEDKKESAVDSAKFENQIPNIVDIPPPEEFVPEETMTDDRPIGGGGGYKINWDEIDENTNPFGVGNAFGGNKLASSPPAGRAPPVQPDSTPASNIPVVSEDPLLNPSGKEVANEVRHVLDPSVTEFGDAKSVPKELKSHNKGPRPAPPKRTVSKGNSHEAEDKKESAVDSAKFENQIPNIVDIPPPEEFVPEEVRLLSLFSLIPISLVNPLIVLYLAKVANNITTAFALVALIAVSNMTSLSTKPQVGNPLVRGHSRRASNSSSATFDLVSGNQSPLPEPEPDRHSLSVDEELMNLRADKQHLTTVVADMQRCIAEYERSLRQLAEEKARAEESAKESVIDIIAERDQAIEEISTIEKAFGDTSSKIRENEEALKKTAQEYQDQLKRQEQKYQSLKAHAEQQLTKVAEETERAKRANEDEVTRLRAAIKRSELRIHSLESQLQQKARSGTLI